MKINMHGMFYSSEPLALREFLRDKLGFPAHDTGDGWLIMDIPEADLGVHPTDFPDSPPSGMHNISFYCDDIHATVDELKSRGVVFDNDIADHGYGYVICFTMPGNTKVDLYQPKYEKK